MILIVMMGLLVFLHLFFDSDRGIRNTLVIAALLLAAFTVLATEILSIFDLITRTAVILTWGISGAVLLGLLVYRVFIKKMAIRDRVSRLWKQSRETFSAFEILVTVCIVTILLITLLIALAAPPNNYDSMTYHMARVAHWIQNQSVNYFPTAIERQNTSAPLAEYIILQLQIISRSDRFANLVQWSAFLFLIILVSEVAKILGMSRRGQLISAFFAATIPMAILQSSSTQNDLVAAAGCLSFLYFMLKTLRVYSVQNLVFAGISLGLALLTKGTAYIYCAAIGLTLGLSRLLARDQKQKLALIGKLTLIIVIGLVMNGGLFARNWIEYRHPLSTESERVRTAQISLEGLVVNAVRNSLVQLAVPFPEANQWITEKTDDVLGALNSDPRYVFIDTAFSVRYTFNEDEASNIFHFVLILIGIGAFPWIRGDKDRDLRWLLASMIFSGLLFSVMIKWQPWGSRLVLPIFFLGAPLIGYLVDRVRIPKLFITVIILGFAVYSIPYLVLNDTRPLVPLFRKSSPLRSNTIKRFFSDRPSQYEKYADLIQPFYAEASVLRTPRREQYFSTNRSYFPDYDRVLNLVNDLELDQLGLDLNSNSWEYPIWVYLDLYAQKGKPELFHLDRDSALRGKASNPDYILSTNGEKSIFTQELGYQILVDTESLDLLRR